MLIHASQMKRLDQQVQLQLDREVRDELLQRAGPHEASDAMIAQRQRDQSLDHWIHQVVGIGLKHGFRSCADLASLARACAVNGTDPGFLVDAVLGHAALLPAEKVQVLLELRAMQGGTR